MTYIFLHLEVNGPPATDSTTDPFRAVRIDATVFNDDGVILDEVCWDISPPVTPRGHKPYKGLSSARVHADLLALQALHRASFLCWWGRYTEILLGLLSRDAGLSPICLVDVETPFGVVSKGDIALAYQNRQILSRGGKIGARGRKPSTDLDLVHLAMGHSDRTKSKINKKIDIFFSIVDGVVASEDILKTAPKDD